MDGKSQVWLTDVVTALGWARTALGHAGVENPRLESQLLLAWALGGRREDLAREPERRLTPREAIIFGKAVSLRAGRRPLAYITGERGFYGRRFKINRAVLIPRWETELLVQRTLERLAKSPSPRVADIGTGSGCIAVTIACERPDATVFATDISPIALLLARKNVVRHSLQDRITLLEGDLMDPLPCDRLFDAIVSNPPYVATDELPDLEPEVRDFEPELALSGVDGASGPLGTGLYPKLIADASTRLVPGGWLLMEVGAGQAEYVQTVLRDEGFEEAQAHIDTAGIPRVVEARKA